MLCWWEVIHTVALTDIYPERYIPPRGLHTYRYRYVAPPEAICSAPTDMYHSGPIHNTGRYVAGVALHTATATYRVQARDISEAGARRGHTDYLVGDYGFISPRFLTIGHSVCVSQNSSALLFSVRL